MRHTSPLRHHVSLCYTALASHTPVCVASDLSACCWPQCLEEFQTFVRLTTSWPTGSNPQQNIKHHSISLLGSVSHKQIKGSTMFLFQLIWKCHIISKRTSVLFMSNILLLLTAQCGPGRARTKQKAKEAFLQEVQSTARAIVLLQKTWNSCNENAHILEYSWGEILPFSAHRQFLFQDSKADSSFPALRQILWDFCLAVWSDDQVSGKLVRMKDELIRFYLHLFRSRTNLISFALPLLLW